MENIKVNLSIYICMHWHALIQFCNTRFFWNAQSFSLGHQVKAPQQVINWLMYLWTVQEHVIHTPYTLPQSVHDMHWLFTILIFFVQTQQLSINNKVSPSPDFPDTELAPMEYHPEKAVDINRFGNSIF